MPETAFDARTNALRLAAIARSLYATQYGGSQESPEDTATYARCTATAHRHGITDDEIDEYLRTQLRK